MLNISKESPDLVHFYMGMDEREMLVLSEGCGKLLWICRLREHLSSHRSQSLVAYGRKSNCKVKGVQLGTQAFSVVLTPHT